MAEAAALSLPRASTLALVGSRALPASVMLVAAVAPFERPLPGSLFGLTLTTVELAILIALGLGGAAWVREPARFQWRTPITLPLAALVAAAGVAALAAPEFRGEAIRVAARAAAAAALFSIFVHAVRTHRIARPLIATFVSAAAIVGVIALFELAQVPWVLNALKAFRPGFHVVGGQLRATSTLFYPTITSMFLEVAFALGLVWIATSRIAFAALVLIGAGIVATFTRAGLITMTVSLLFYGAMLFRRHGGWGREHTRLAGLAIVLAGLVLMSRSPQMLVARMSAEGSQEWYGASYTVPQRLTLSPGSFNDVPVTLRNEGRIAWRSSDTPPFALSYHWLAPGSEDVLIFDGLRTPFTEPVPPGADVKLMARVRAPEYPGDYVLIWDVVQEHRTWLSLEGVYPGRSTAVVEGTPAGPPLASRGRMPSSIMRLPRSVLWTTALQMAREHPLLGIGPDNFRHTYGRYLGLAAWDTRVHANNTYLEVLSGMGAIGAIALTWLLVAAARSMRDVLAGAGTALPVAAASAAACLAIGAHALVDSFVTFTPTYVAFAIAAALLYAHPTEVPCA